MKIKSYRTVSTRIKPGGFAQALDAMQLAAKNLKNMGLFLVKNVLSCFDFKDKVYAIKPLSEMAKSHRSKLMMRLVETPKSVDDFALEILEAHSNAMVMRDSEVCAKATYPSYAIAIPDDGLVFDICLLEFDPRGKLADVERAVLVAAYLMEDGGVACKGKTSRRL